MLIPFGVMAQTSEKDSILNYLHNYNYTKIDSVIVSKNFSVENFLKYAKLNYIKDMEKSRACYSFVINYMKYSNYITTQEYVIGYKDAIRLKKGVCYNYSCLYKYLCNELGLKCEMVSGFYKRLDPFYNRGTLEPHGWNMVTIDNINYLTDVTADDNRSEYISKSWYIINPEVFIETHYPYEQYFLKNMITRTYVEVEGKIIVPDDKIFVDVAYNYYKKNQELLEENCCKKVASFQCLEKPITLEYFICKRIKYYAGTTQYKPIKTLPSNYYNLYLKM